jgi:hypothetical protein
VAVAPVLARRRVTSVARGGSNAGGEQPTSGKITAKRQCCVRKCNIVRKKKLAANKLKKDCALVGYVVRDMDWSVKARRA